MGNDRYASRHEDHHGPGRGSADDLHQAVVLLPLLEQQVSAVDQLLDADGRLGVGDLLLVDGEALRARLGRRAPRWRRGRRRAPKRLHRPRWSHSPCCPSPLRPSRRGPCGHPGWTGPPCCAGRSALRAARRSEEWNPGHEGERRLKGTNAAPAQDRPELWSFQPRQLREAMRAVTLPGKGREGTAGLTTCRTWVLQIAPHRRPTT